MLKYLFILFGLPIVIQGQGDITKRGASRYNEAYTAFEAHYHTKQVAINRCGSGLSGAGFWQGFTDDSATGTKHRLMFLGEREYVRPHTHESVENFTVVNGGCKIWTQSSVRGNKRWSLLVANPTTPISIPAEMLYCVLATNDLCMHQILDRTQTVKPWTFETKPNLPFRVVEVKSTKK
ncbi:hypothetical protein HOM50_03420 [bacterium]|jgi:hypothetical protein|nr:hypothetical protein [bacterium]MBT5015427.1 hypothetical protein [bacterium]